MIAWVPLIIGSILFSSVARVLQKKIYQGSKISSEFASVIFQFFSSFIIFVFAVLNGFNLDGIENYIPNLILLALLYTAMNYFLFKAFKQSEAGTVTILFSSSAAWVLIVSAIVLSETITLVKVVGIVLIFIAVVLLTLESGKLKFDRALLYPLIAAILLAIAFVNDVYISTKVDLLSFLSLAFLLPGLLSISLILPGRKYLEIRDFKTNDYVKNIGLALFYALSTILAFQAYKMGAEASIVSPLLQLSIFLTVILSYFFLKERKNIKLKLLTSLLAVAGGVILTLA